MRSELDRLMRRTGRGDPGAARKILEGISSGAFNAESVDLVAVARALIASGKREENVRGAMADAGIGVLDRWSAVDSARGREPDLWMWNLVAYDVWGNAEDGWEVNDMHLTGDGIVLPGDVSGEEAAEALAEAGLTRTVLEVDHQEEHAIIFCLKSGKPVGEVRRAHRVREVGP